MTVVTVVMPVRNEERTVAGAIASVLAQSYADLELLVVDGDSTDGTAAVVAELAGKDARVRLLDNPGRTIPHGLNVGFGQARGRYLARVDAHASINRSYLLRAVQTLDADPAVAAVGGRRFGVATSGSGVAIAAAVSSRYGVGDSINHYATTAQDTDHASFGVYRVEVLRQVGGWDEDLIVNEDVDLDHRVLAAGHRIHYDPDMCIFWHVRESVPGLMRQYRRYGRGKALMIRKNGRSAMRARHAAPPIALATVVAAGAAGALGWWPVGLALAAPYLVATAVATAVTSRRREPVRRPDDPTLSWTAEPVLPPGSLSGARPGTRLANLPGSPPNPLGTDTPAGGFTRSAATRVGDLSVIETTSDVARNGPDGGRSAPLPGPARPPAVRTVLDLTDTVGPSLVTVGDSDGGRRPSAARLAGAFTAMHLSWGLGFVESAVFGWPPADSSARLPRHPSRTARPAA